MVARISLFTLVLRATLITAGLWLALVLAGLTIRTTPTLEGLLGAFATFIPSGVAAWWFFRRLRLPLVYWKARLLAILFAVLAPVSLLAAIPIAQISGGYTGLLGRPFGFLGAMAGVIAFMTVICFAACSLALWIVRRK
jgi:hypothetical protein